VNVALVTVSVMVIVGFTAGTGGQTAAPEVITWTYGS
jgi:hypothetical protein